LPARAGASFCAGCGGNLQSLNPGLHQVTPTAPRAQVHEQLLEIKRIAWLFGLLLLSSLVLGLVSRVNDSPWPEAMISALDALIIVAFAVRYRTAIVPLLRLPQMRWLEGLQLIAMAVLFMLVLRAFFSTLHAWGVPMAEMTTGLRKFGWSVSVMFVLISVMPALFEELAFRGVIQSNLENILGPRDALIIQAALFSVLHLSPLIFPSHFAMGLFFGWMRTRTRSLYPGVAIHATWNALVLFEELHGM